MKNSEEANKRWKCPSDRELTLRAKIRAGWSSRANADDGNHDATTINEDEQIAILRVLERANKTQEFEEQRIRKLQERFDRMKRQARGKGGKNCILCDGQPRFFSRFYHCKDCQNAVCNKCSVDSIELESGHTTWLCKICSELREVLKKTNKWTQLVQTPAIMIKPQTHETQ